MADKKIAFAINATWRSGGQGEFLRQMAMALQRFPDSQVYCRSWPAERTPPPTGFPLAPQVRYRLPGQLLGKLPFFRARRDWNILWGDLDFDSQVAARVAGIDIFDGVAGQCATTLEKLKSTATRRVMTCLNTHITFLSSALRTEHLKIGVSGNEFIHPKMQERILREIELAEAIRVNSQWAKQTFVEAGVPEEKLFVVYPGLDKKHFRPAPKRDSVFRVLAVSSIDLRKGTRYLLQAFEEARIPNSELVLIGGTGDHWNKAMLQGYLSRNGNIRLAPQDVTVVPVEETYGMASVVVHPAVEDGYGLVVAQALACGRPVIVTRQTGASELIHDGQEGFVVESGSVVELKECLQCLANDVQLRKTMSEAAPKAAAELSDEQFTKDMRVFYEHCVG